MLNIFAYCSNLDIIKVDSNNSCYDSRDNCNAIIETASNTLIIGGRNTVIPSSVTSIGNAAFYSCSNLISVTIPSSVTKIGRYAFSRCSSLSSVTIPSSVTSIGFEAFSGCSSLNSVTIPSSVTSISTSAFEGTAWYKSQPDGLVYAGKVAYEYKGTMPSNTEIILREGTTGIASSAFRNCSGLTSLTIPSSVMTIGNDAFYGCRNLTNIYIPNSVTSVGMNAFSGTVWYDNLPNGVVYVGKVAYNYKGTMPSKTEITLKEGTVEITGGAFSGCSNLISVTMPSSITSIGAQAFYLCRNLTSVTIPSNVLSIGNEAFNLCYGLSSVTIYISKPLIMTETTFSDRAKAILYVPHNSKGAYEAAKYWKDFKEIVEMPQNDETLISDIIEFTDANVRAVCVANWDFNRDGELSKQEAAVVTDLGKAFYNNTSITSFDELQYFTGMTKISDYAFSGCSKLASITIPSSVTNIGNSAFYGTAWYNNQSNGLIYAGKFVCGYKGTMPDKTEITIKDGTVGIADAAFSYCYNLTSVSIPSSVTTIGSSAFQGCSKLNSVTIPSNVTSIGSSAFCDCSELNYVYSETESPFAFGERAFSGISPVCVLNIPANTKDKYLNAGWTTDVFKGGVIDPAVPEVVSIEKGNWFTAKTIEGVDMRFMITDVSQHTIQVGLSSSNEYWKSTKGAVNKTISGVVTIPDKVVYGGIEFSVTYIANAAFRECSKITAINIPESVTHIGHGAFEFCSGLTSIYIPNSVTSIDDGYAFVDCANLQSVHISENLKVIPNDTFTRCYSLTSVTIPEGVTNVGKNMKENSGDAFYECTGLTTIIIPSSVTYYVGNSFYSCDNLTTVIVHRTEPVNISSSSFKNRRKATLYVPTGSKAAYESAAVWKEFKEIIEFEPEEPKDPEPVMTEDETLSVEEVTMRTGQTASVEFCLVNKATDLTAYQFDLTLPEGFTLAVNGKGKPQVTKTSRYEDDSQTLNISKVEGGNTWRFVCFSMSNGKIEGVSGAILNAVMAVGDAVEPGTYEAAITDIVFTRADGTQLKLANAKFSIVIDNMVMGDANGDGDVNVSDIVEIVNCIMGKPSAKFVKAAADMNGDGDVNVTDIVMVVNSIMGSGSGASSRSEVDMASATDNDKLLLTDGLSLRLENEGSYVAAQFDVKLADGQTIDDISLNGERSGRHLLTYAKTGSNIYKVVVYSLDNSSFSGHSGELLSIHVTGSGDVTLENIVFVTAGNAEKRFAPIGGNATGLKAIDNLQFTIDNCYDLQGRRVTATKKGIYVVNGKKHVVR